VHFDIMVNKVPWKGECILLYEKFVWFISEDAKKVLCEPSIHHHQILTLNKGAWKKKLPYADTFYFFFFVTIIIFSVPHLSKHAGQSYNLISQGSYSPNVIVCHYTRKSFALLSQIKSWEWPLECTIKS
jgi:hypothetical protein